MCGFLGARFFLAPTRESRVDIPDAPIEIIGRSLSFHAKISQLKQ